MNPQQALAIIPGFADAQLVTQLADGITANSWQVELTGQRFVLRIDKAEAQALGLDREGEREVQETIAGAGLTPAAEFHDAVRGVSLRHWVDGRPWSAADLQLSTNLKRLGYAMRKIHQLPPVGPRYEPGEAASRYADHLGTSDAIQLAEEVNRQLAVLRDSVSQDCLCHNDLVAENLVDTGDQLVPIDWEYAGMGDPLFDLAVLIEHHELQTDLSECLLRAYFSREVTGGELLRIKSWCHFYSLLLKLWQLRTHA